MIKPPKPLTQNEPFKKLMSPKPSVVGAAMGCQVTPSKERTIKSVPEYEKFTTAAATNSPLPKSSPSSATGTPVELTFQLTPSLDVTATPLSPTATKMPLPNTTR